MDMADSKMDKLEQINLQKMTFKSYKKRLRIEIEKFEVLVQSGKMSGGTCLDCIIEKQNCVNRLMEQTVVSFRMTNKTLNSGIVGNGIN